MIRPKCHIKVVNTGTVLFFAIDLRTLDSNPFFFTNGPKLAPKPIRNLYKIRAFWNFGLKDTRWLNNFCSPVKKTERLVNGFKGGRRRKGVEREEDDNDTILRRNKPKPLWDVFLKTWYLILSFSDTIH